MYNFSVYPNNFPFTGSLYIQITFCTVIINADALP